MGPLGPGIYSGIRRKRDMETEPQCDGGGLAPVLGWSWRWLIWPCIHASMHPSAVLAQLSHATHCPSCGKWAHGQHSRVGADRGDRVSPEGLLQGPDGKWVRRKMAGVTPGPRRAGCVCVCLSLRDHFREPRVFQNWKTSDEATKSVYGRGIPWASRCCVRCKEPGTADLRGVTAFIWDIHSLVGSGFPWGNGTVCN